MSTQDSSSIGRNPWACKPCRKLKVRCFTSEQGAVCKKCLKSGAECIFEEQKPPRKRRRVDARSLVKDLEARIDDLQARVEEPKQDINISVHGGFRTPESTQHDIDFTPKLPNPTYWPLPITNNTSEGMKDDATTPEELLSSCTMSEATMLEHLQQFRRMSEHFPFVILPDEVALSWLRKDRPVLLLAIIAVTTSIDVKLQKELERGLRKTLFQRIMLENEKSIELLQALLVYLAWYHFFFIPKKEQSYQLLQMAIGMSVDLGLGMKPEQAVRRGYGLKLDHYKEEESGEWYSEDARRAYLGCYYISTNTAWVWAKPENMKYNTYMEDCARSLACGNRLSDRQLWPLIEMRRYGQQFYEDLRNADGEEDIQILLQLFDQVRGRVSFMAHSDHQESLIFKLSSHHATAHAYEMDLLNPFVPTRERYSKKVDTIPNNSSSVKSALLTTCMQSCKSFVDCFLSIPSSEYNYVTSIQWSGLVYSIVVLYRLSLGTPNMPEWDRNIARNHLKLEVYIELLCYRLQHVTKQRREGSGENGEDLFSVTGLIFENVRSNFERLLKLPAGEAAEDVGHVHAVTFMPPTISESNADACPVKVGSSTSTAPHHEPEVHYHNRCPAFQWWGWSVPTQACSAYSLPTPATVASDQFWSTTTESIFQQEESCSDT